MEYYGFGLVGAAEGKPHREPMDFHLRMVERADELGMDGWFFAEHHIRPGFSLTPSPNLLIAAVARRTKKLRLGNMVNILPYHHPLRLAEEIRMLDTITGGRLEVGYGRGQIRVEQAGFGVVRSETVEHFDAAYDVVRRLLEGEAVTSHTKWWTIDEAVAVPEAVQTPVPPSWMAAGSDSSVEKAARLGLHCGTSLLTRAVVDARMAEFKEKWDRFHPDRMGESKFAVGLAVSVAETRDLAFERVLNEFETKQEHFAHSITDTPGADDETYVTHKPNYEKFAAASIDELIDNHLLVAGTVEDCRDQVAEIRDRGIDTIITHFHNPFSAIEESWTSFELFATEVIPHVEGRELPLAKAGE